jgi:hypothetical protein
LKDEEKALLAPVLLPVIFGISSNFESVANEKDHLACCRLGLIGTRQVVVTSTSVLLDCMRSAGAKQDDLNPPKAWHFLKSASDDVLKNYIATTGCLWSATLGAGDALFLPTGWTQAERVLQNVDFVGVRCS